MLPHTKANIKIQRTVELILLVLRRESTAADLGVRRKGNRCQDLLLAISMLPIRHRIHILQPVTSNRIYS
jgi:hypothetical protein